MIPISEPDLTKLERQYLLEAFDSGWISSRGSFVDRAEAALRDLSQTAFASVTSNGTTALHLALMALGIGEGDEVIMPDLSYVATLNSVLYVGATPVLVDVDPSTWCIDANEVRRATTPRTAAILAVDIYGHPADYGSLRRVAEETGCAIIADAAESIGAQIDRRTSAPLADVAVYSFFGNKVVTSGEGGAVVTDDADLDARVRQLKNQGNHAYKRYHHDILGYNYRMTNLSAAILAAQLDRFPHLVNRRRGIVEQYSEALGSRPDVQLQGVSVGVTPTPWLFSIRLLDGSGGDRDRVMALLADKYQIETRPIFRPLSTMPYDIASSARDAPIAKAISEQGMSLPTFPGMSDDNVSAVIEALTDVLAEVCDHS